MLVRIYAVPLHTGTVLKCMMCDRAVQIEEDIWVTIFQCDSFQIFEETGGLTVHKCGREMVWNCFACSYNDPGMYRDAPWCPLCRTPMRQRPLVPGT